MRRRAHLHGGVRLAASASLAIWARRIAPYLVQVIVAQRADAMMFEAAQRMVCVAHATQHVAEQAPLACVVRRHDLDAVAEAQLPGEIRRFLVSGNTSR